MNGIELFGKAATRARNKPDDTKAPCGVLNYLEVLRALDKLLKEDVHKFCQNCMEKRRTVKNTFYYCCYCYFCVLRRKKKAKFSGKVGELWSILKEIKIYYFFHST